MNQRLKELYTQVCMEQKLPFTVEHNSAYMLDAFADKLAELIIRECIEKITTYDLVPGHSAKWEDIYDIHARLLQDLGEELKEHFGVEQ
jgi:hypothetical protein